MGQDTSAAPCLGLSPALATAIVAYVIGVGSADGSRTHF